MILEGKCLEELWKDIKDYNGAYQISNLGRIRSRDRHVENGQSGYIRKGHIMKSLKHNNGYYSITICKNAVRTFFMVHRLVAAAFIPNPYNKSQVNHKNGIKGDNRVENLEWNTRKENIKHGFDTGLINRKSISIPVTGINIETNDRIEFKSMRSAKDFGFCQSSISSCVRGIYNSHKGYKWYRTAAIESACKLRNEQLNSK